MAIFFPRDTEEPVVNEGRELNEAIWCLTAFSWLFLALRIYCKVWRKRSLWWDDYILILAWVSILSSTVILSVGVNYGIGLHYDDMRPEYLPIQAQLSYAAGFCAILGTAWSKTSFALTMLRITQGPTKWFLVFIIVTVNIILTVSGTLMWVSCWPTKKLWYPDTPGTCWDRTVGEKYQTFASAYSATMDIILALLPWRIVWNASLNKREMVGALVAMSAGVVSGIITFLKILVLPEISDDDSTTVNLKIYGTAEPAVAIIAASIPVLRAFLRKRPHSQQTVPEDAVHLSSNLTSLSSPTLAKSPRSVSWQTHDNETEPSISKSSQGRVSWQHHEIRHSYKR